MGLVGFGRISYLSDAEIEKHGAKPVSLDRLIKESDFISIHIPGTKETHHLFGLEQFRKMKPTTYLINTARGSIIDEQALYTAVSQGLIAGAGLDVMEKEPPDINNPLLELDNVLITPHDASYSETSYLKLRRYPVEDVARVLQKQWPKYFVNPEVKDNFVKKWKWEMS